MNVIRKLDNFDAEQFENYQSIKQKYLDFLNKKQKTQTQYQKSLIQQAALESLLKLKKHEYNQTKDPMKTLIGLRQSLSAKNEQIVQNYEKSLNSLKSIELHISL